MLGADDSCWNTASEKDVYVLTLGSVLCFTQGCVARNLRALELELCSKVYAVDAKTCWR